MNRRNFVMGVLPAGALTFLFGVSSLPKNLFAQTTNPWLNKMLVYLRLEEPKIGKWLDSKDGKERINFLTGKAKGWWFSSDNGRKQYDAVYWGILMEAGIQGKPTQIGEWVKWMKAQDPDPIHEEFHVGQQVVFMNETGAALIDPNTYLFEGWVPKGTIGFVTAVEDHYSKYSHFHVVRVRVPGAHSRLTFNFFSSTTDARLHPRHVIAGNIEPL